MSQKLHQVRYDIELGFILLCLAQAVFNLPAKIVLPLAALACLVSYLKERSRPYSFLLYLELTLFSIRAFANVSILRFFEIAVLVAAIIGRHYLRYSHLGSHFQLYEDNANEKRFSAGFTKATIGKGAKVQVAVFYPTNQKTGPKAKWLQFDNWYNSIAQVSAGKSGPPPVSIIKATYTYLENYEMNCIDKASIAQDPTEFKVILFSHGLSAHFAAYSGLTQWFATRGYIVVSVMHPDDVIFRQVPSNIKTDEALHEYLYGHRNRDLLKRRQQLTQAYNQVVEGNLLSGLLGREVKISSVEFAGHSFGGATIIETGATLVSRNSYELVKGYMLLDPWLYPISESTYTSLSRPVLFLNAEHFVGLQPHIEDRHAANTRFQSKNSQMTRLYVAGMEHMHIGDPMHTLGTGLKLAGVLKGIEQIPHYQETVAFLIYLWQQGVTGQDLVNQTNRKVDSAYKSKNGGPVFLDTRKTKHEQRKLA